MEFPEWVLDTIKDHSGLDASLLSGGALMQAVHQRVGQLSLPDPATYWTVLRSQGREIDSLIQTLTNKETYFYREPRQFEALSRRVLPELVALHSRPGTRAHLRLWSAGCATGEEAYTLAMVVTDYAQSSGARFEATIIGTDIDPHSIERARQGCYEERAVRHLPEALGQRYLVKQDAKWCVQPEVARLVTFRPHNLAVDTIPHDLNHLDVIFCRNVTMYFVEAMRDRLNARLAAQLREGGYLFVASAETLGHDRGRLTLVALGEGFAFRKTPAAEQPARPSSMPPGVAAPQPSARGSTAAAAAPGTRRPAAPRRTGAHVAPTSRPVSPAQAAEPSAASLLIEAGQRAFREQAYEDALAYLDLLPVADQARSEPSCLRAAILLQQEKLEEANQICRRVLEANLWHPDAYLLLALGYRQQGRGAEAVDMLKQAVYLRPDDPQAHFFLGDTYRRLGLAVEARREYENTLNILDRQAAGTARPRPGPTEINLAGVPDDLMRRACRTHLARAPRGRSQ